MAAYDMSLSEVTRKGRDLAKDPPNVEHVVMAKYITELYSERQGFTAFDNNADGFTPDDGSVTGADIVGADAPEGVA